MAGLGETLKNERLRRQITLEQISKISNISVNILSDMENERFEAVRGKFYIKNFLKSYLGAIEVDADRFFEENKDLIRSLYSRERNTPYIHYNKLRYSRFKRKNFFFTFFLLLILIVAVFCFFYSSRHHFFGAFDPSSRELHFPITHPELIPDLAGKIIPHFPNSSFSLDFSPLNVRMEFQQQCWVDVYRGGQRYFEKVLYSGETEEIKGYRLDITLGNPAAVKFYLNGKELTQYNELGKPVKIRLDPLRVDGIIPK
jgi:transcriptional regulator with XRE-family HTH domain